MSRGYPRFPALLACLTPPHHANHHIHRCRGQVGSCLGPPRDCAVAACLLQPSPHLPPPPHRHRHPHRSIPFRLHPAYRHRSDTSKHHGGRPCGVYQEAHLLVPAMDRYVLSPSVEHAPFSLPAPFFTCFTAHSQTFFLVSTPCRHLHAGVVGADLVQ